MTAGGAADWGLVEGGRVAGIVGTDRRESARLGGAGGRELALDSGCSSSSSDDKISIALRLPLGSGEDDKRNSLGLRSSCCGGGVGALFPLAAASPFASPFAALLPCSAIHAGDPYLPSVVCQALSASMVTSSMSSGHAARISNV